MDRKTRPPETQPDERSFPISRWTIVIACIGIAFVVLTHKPQVAEWIVSNGPSFLFSHNEAPFPDKDISKTEPLPAVKRPAPVKTGYVPQVKTVSPATQASTDECAAWGKDSSAYINCEDHKKKVKALLETERERQKDLLTSEEKENMRESSTASRKSERSTRKKSNKETQKSDMPVTAPPPSSKK